MLTRKGSSKKSKIQPVPKERTDEIETAASEAEIAQQNADQDAVVLARAYALILSWRQRPSSRKTKRAVNRIAQPAKKKDEARNEDQESATLITE